MKNRFLLSISLLFIPNVIISVPGVLDPTFGNGTGIVITNFGVGSEARGVTIQEDGKIVLSGRSTLTGFTLARYNIDGSLDTSFNPTGADTGIPGTVRIPFGGGDLNTSIAIQKDGKIVAAGATTIGPNATNFALARYNIDGSLDPSFNPTGAGTGVPGVVLTDFGDDSNAESIVIQQDGKIVLGGTVDDEDFALARYNTDGSLDTSFNPIGAGSGIPGTVRTNSGALGIPLNGFSVKVQEDGKTILGGTGNADFALARYNTDGSLDTSFNPTGAESGIPGVVLSDFSVASDCFSIVIQSDGKIIAGGTANNNALQDFALARYNKDGSLDTSSFNPTGTGSGIPGVVFSNFGGTVNGIFSVLLQPDGKIVAGGQQQSGALARYNTDGSLDTSFNPTGVESGIPGVAFTNFGTDSLIRSIAIQEDGKIIVVGEGDNNFALARYLNDTYTLTKEASAENPCPGQNIFYTVTVTNFGGGGTVNGIYVDDVLPAELIFRSAQTKGADSTFDKTTGVWFIPRLCVGEQAILKIKARVGQFAGNQTICNTAVSSYSSIDNVTGSSLFDELGVSTTEIYSTTECVSTLPVLYENPNHIAQRADCGTLDLNMALCDTQKNIDIIKTQQQVSEELLNQFLLKLDCILGF